MASPYDAWTRGNVLGGGGYGGYGGGGYGLPSLTSYGGGGGGNPRMAGGAVGGGAGSAAFSYDPYKMDPLLQQNLTQMSQYASGLMDPNSDYYKQLQAAMTAQLGGQAAAGQRAAALRGAWSGFGAGASPEMMATAGEIGRGGLEAAGQASAGLALQAPQLGSQIMGQTYGPLLGMGQLGAQQAEFGAGLGLQQQSLAAQQAYQEAMLQQQQQQLLAQMAMGWGGY